MHLCKEANEVFQAWFSSSNWTKHCNNYNNFQNSNDACLKRRNSEAEVRLDTLRISKSKTDTCNTSTQMERRSQNELAIVRLCRIKLQSRCLPSKFLVMVACSMHWLLFWAKGEHQVNRAVTQLTFSSPERRGRVHFLMQTHQYSFSPLL